MGNYKEILNRLRILTLIQLVLIIFVISSNYSNFMQTSTNDNSIERTQPISSGIHAPIDISSDSELDDYCSGNGTTGSEINPHIIENYTIETSGIGIRIVFVSSFLIIRNCTIICSGVSTIGFKIEDSDNITISNCSVYQSSTGIDIDYSDYMNVTNCNIFIYGNGNGILAEESNNMDITSVNITSISSSQYLQKGIYLDDCNYNNILYCNISHAEIGISIYSSDNNIIGSNLIYDICPEYITNARRGIYASYSYLNTMIFNDFINSTMYFLSSTQNTITTSNKLNEKSIYYYENTQDFTSDGIGLENVGQVILNNCSSTTIENYLFNSVYLSLSIQGGENNLVKNSSFQNTDISISIYDSNNFSIMNNTFNECQGYNINPYSSFFTRVENNTFNSCKYGFTIFDESSRYSRILNNSFFNCKYSINAYVKDSIIKNNNFIITEGGGNYVFEIYSSNVTIEDNYFESNVDSARCKLFSNMTIRNNIFKGIGIQWTYDDMIIYNNTFNGLGNPEFFDFINRNNVNFTYNKVFDYSTWGLKITRSSNFFIDSNEIYGNSKGGIYLDLSNSVIISNNTIRDNQINNGLLIVNDNTGLISNNTLLSNDLSISYGDKANFDDLNTINGGKVFFRKDTIENNIVLNDLYSKFLLYNCNDSIISNFNVSGDFSEIKIYNCENLEISNVSISGIEDPFDIYNCTNIYLFDMEYLNCLVSIQVNSSLNISFTDFYAIDCITTWIFHINNTENFFLLDSMLFDGKEFEYPMQYPFISYTGIMILDSSNIQILRNIMTNYIDIFIDNCNNFVFCDNKMENCYRTFVYYSDNVTFNQNLISNKFKRSNIFEFITWYSNNINISSNTIAYGKIYILYSDISNIYNNTIFEFYRYNAIDIDHSSNCIIESNKLSNCYEGLLVTESDNIRICSNTFENISLYCVSVLKINTLIICNNYFNISSGTAIRIRECTNVDKYGNIIIDPRIKIYWIGGICGSLGLALIIWKIIIKKKNKITDLPSGDL